MEGLNSEATENRLNISSFKRSKTPLQDEYGLESSLGDGTEADGEGDSDGPMGERLSRKEKKRQKEAASTFWSTLL